MGRARSTVMLSSEINVPGTARPPPPPTAPDPKPTQQPALDHTLQVDLDGFADEPATRCAFGEVVGLREWSAADFAGFVGGKTVHP
jgi:hypothetical protein